ncbi:MAG TPA: hypothetical protein VHD90_13410 [Phototrophicaceae bacterium]|nr:hypothetical protein [Phototrophicaceae bacterium]
MSTPYFTQQDHQSLASLPTPDAQVVYDKFYELHRTLYRRMRDHNYDLHPHWNKAQLVSNHSATCSNEITGLTLPYLRSQEQGMLVERLMGRDGVDAKGDIYRHPVIELRITPAHFAIELVMSPLSWWDQRNLIGKLSVARHRETLRGILQRVDGDYRFGFWDGAHLSDMHLTSRQLLRGNILEEWMGTFADGQDWLRIGVWYEPEDPALSADRILNEVVQRMVALQTMYTFMLWTSNNNFQSFYRKTAPMNSRDARM